MSINYLTGALLALFSGFVVVASQAFPADVLSWVAFGIGVAIICITVLAQLDRSRGCAQRGLDVATFVVAGLMLVFALVESGSTVIWLSFAFALGAVALAFGGLTVHEVDDWHALRDASHPRTSPLPQVSMAPASASSSQHQAA